jgi:hypothetical protein
VTLQNFVQPGSRGSGRPNRDEIGQSHSNSAIDRASHATLLDLPLSIRTIAAGSTVRTIRM